MADHQFSVENNYMFSRRIPNGASDKLMSEVVVEKPSSIFEDSINFKMPDNSLLAVKKANIIAVEDLENGTVRVKGLKEKYIILNQRLFDKCIAAREMYVQQ